MFWWHLHYLSVKSKLLKLNSLIKLCHWIKEPPCRKIFIKSTKVEGLFTLCTFVYKLCA